MWDPPSDESIQDPMPPAKEEENDVSHFPFQFFDDTLFYDSEGKEERESLDDLDPLYYESKYVWKSHEDEALMLSFSFEEVIQVFNAPA